MLRPIHVFGKGKSGDVSRVFPCRLWFQLPILACVFLIQCCCGTIANRKTCAGPLFKKGISIAAVFASMADSDGMLTVMRGIHGRH